MKTTMQRPVETKEISRRPVGNRFAITWACTLPCGCVINRETPARGTWWSPPSTVKHTH